MSRRLSPDSDLPDPRAEALLEGRQELLFQGRKGGEGGGEGIARTIALEDEEGSSPGHLSEQRGVPGGVNPRNEGGSEFEGNSRGEKKVHALPDQPCVPLPPGSKGVSAPGGLDIHGDIVEKSVGEKGLQDIRAGAVRVELDLEAEAPDGGEKVRELLLKGWLPPCDADSVEKGLPAFEVGEKGVRRKGGPPFSRKDEIGIMAERAAELAARTEEDRRRVGRIVKKTCLNIPSDGERHAFLPLFPHGITKKTLHSVLKEKKYLIIE